MSRDGVRCKELWLNGPSVKLLPSITIFPTERLAGGAGEGWGDE